MRVTAYTDTARDYYLHLPDLRAWVAAFDVEPEDLRAQETERRLLLAAKALEALPRGDNPYADCCVRVGYDPQKDEPMFIRKVDKGYIYVAQ